MSTDKNSLYDFDNYNYECFVEVDINFILVERLVSRPGSFAYEYL